MKAIGISLLAAMALSLPASAGMEGWRKGGNTPELYDAGMNGKGAGYIKALGGGSRGKYATVQQTISADAYRGKRVRLSARVKRQDGEGRLNLWILVGSQKQFLDRRFGDRVDGVGWSRSDVVLDIKD